MSKTKTQRERVCQMTLSGCFLLKKITNCLAGCDKWRLWKTHQRKTKIAWSQDCKLHYFSILIPLYLDNKSIDIHIFKKDLSYLQYISTTYMYVTSFSCAILAEKQRIFDYGGLRGVYELINFYTDLFELPWSSYFCPQNTTHSFLKWV